MRKIVINDNFNSIDEMNHSDYKNIVSQFRDKYEPQEIRNSLGLSTESHDHMKKVFGELINEKYFGIDSISDNYEILKNIKKDNNIFQESPSLGKSFKDYIQDVKENNHTLKNATMGKKITRMILDLSMSKYVKPEKSNEKVSIFRNGKTTPVKEYDGEVAEFARNADALRPDDRPGREGVYMLPLLYQVL